MRSHADGDREPERLSTVAPKRASEQASTGRDPLLALLSSGFAEATTQHVFPDTYDVTLALGKWSRGYTSLALGQG